MDRERPRHGAKSNFPGVRRTRAATRVSSRDRPSKSQGSNESLADQHQRYTWSGDAQSSVKFRLKITHEVSDHTPKVKGPKINSMLKDKLRHQSGKAHVMTREVQGIKKPVPSAKVTPNQEGRGESSQARMQIAEICGASIPSKEHRTRPNCS